MNIRTLSIVTVAMLGLNACGDKKAEESPPKEQAAKAIPPSVAYTGKPVKEEDRILCENKPYSDADLHQATLNVIFTKLKYFGSDVPTMGALLAEKHKLELLYPWAKSIDNGKIRNAYLEWLDSYQKDYDDLEAAIKNPTVKTEEQDRDQESRERAERAVVLARCLPKPTL